MAGLLNATQGSAAPTNASADSLKDPILQKIERGIEAKVPPEMKKDYLAVVVAGMRIMYSEETAHLIDDQLKSSTDIVKNVSEGIAKLIGMISNESKGSMSQPAAALASISLMAQALDYAERKYGTTITPEIAAACTKATATAVLGVFNIGQDQVDQQIAKGRSGAPQEQAQPSQPQTQAGM